MNLSTLIPPLIAEGLTTPEIADRLDVSPALVRRWRADNNCAATRGAPKGRKQRRYAKETP